MTEEQKIEYKKLIEFEIIETESLLKDLIEDNKPVSIDNSIGRLSRMDAINNKSVREENQRMSERKLKNLQNILQKYNNDSFGKCFRCGNYIPYNRLSFMPDATTCLSCQ